ncbi:MAG: HNH endonuclease, partial [Planctomycetaceae bacterium]|nr:HNH endonuclease [Planctomycetaceae bacterium]
TTPHWQPLFQTDHRVYEAKPSDDAGGTHNECFRLTKRKLQTHRFFLWQHSPHCRYCGRRIVAFGASTLDHIVPVSRGGDDIPSNLALCCSHCNFAKASRTLEEWVADLIHGAAPCLVPALKEGGAL